MIVSADDVAEPIIGYYKTGSFELNESTPPALKAWLDNIDQNIKQAKKEGKDSSKHTKEWNKWSAAPSSFKKTLLYSPSATSGGKDTLIIIKISHILA